MISIDQIESLLTFCNLALRIGSYTEAVIFYFLASKTLLLKLV